MPEQEQNQPMKPSASGQDDQTFDARSQVTEGQDMPVKDSPFSETAEDTANEGAEEAASSGNTTHDLREAAEEAVRLFNEAQAADQAAPGDPSRSATLTEIGNTTHDLAREAYRAMQMEMEERRLQQEREQQAAQDAMRFTDAMALRIDVPESQKSIHVAVSNQDIIIGRADNVTDYTPEIDLTPHGAYRLGLSRRHAMIRRDGEKLILKDLNSRNGTFVNGEAIKGGATHALRDGDELRFGNLTTRVNYIRDDAD